MVKEFGSTQIATNIQTTSNISELTYTVFYIFCVFGHVVSGFVIKVWLLVFFG